MQKFTTNNLLDDSRNSILTDTEASPIANDELKVNCRALCEKIRKSLKDCILGNLRERKK